MAWAEEKLRLLYTCGASSSCGYVVVARELNTWLSKTWCERYPCDVEEPLTGVAAALLKPVARELLDRARAWGVSEVVVRQWRHYCGLRPRYYTIVAGRKPRWPHNPFIVVTGGEKWRVAATVNLLGVRVYSDGCWDWATLSELLESIVSKNVITIPLL